MGYEETLGKMKNVFQLFRVMRDLTEERIERAKQYANSLPVGEERDQYQVLLTDLLVKWDEIGLDLCAMETSIKRLESLIDDKAKETKGEGHGS